MAKFLTKWHAKAGVELTRVNAIDVEIKAYLVDRNGVHRYKNDECTFFNEANNQFEDSPELTTLPMVIEEIETLVNDNPALKALTYRVGTDPGCIEIPSAPLKSWTKLRSFYMQIDKICAQFGWTANENACGTGGHIHVEHLNQQLLQLKVLRDQYYRPYVMWAFASQRDNDNAIPLSNGEFPQLKLNWFQKKYYNTEIYEVSYEGCAVVVKTQTIEFRVFDMTWNWEEQEEHMAYVQAYMAWIKSPKYVEPKPLKYSRYHDIPVAEAERMFKNHIEEIGLPWDRYYKYVGNIRGRRVWKTNDGKIHPQAMKSMKENIARYDQKDVMDSIQKLDSVV